MSLFFFARTHQNAALSISDHSWRTDSAGHRDDQRRCGADMHAKHKVMMTAGLPMPTVAAVVAAHVANLIGADRVCLGSDHGAVDSTIDGASGRSVAPTVEIRAKTHKVV